MSKTISFEDFGLSLPLLDSIKQLGYTQPTEIQAEAIPVMLPLEDDFIGLAQTGTGKTAAFGLPILENLNLDNHHTQAIILCPTRELSLQVAEDLNNLGQFVKKLRVEAIYGGTSIDRQIQVLKKGIHIIVGTPGRVIDLINRKKIHLNDVNVVVLDEADKMLEMGFVEDVEYILSKTNEQKKVWLFSATLPAEIKKISDQYMNQPIEVTVGHKNVAASNVVHQYYLAKDNNKLEVVQRILDLDPNIYALIFSRTKVEAQDTAEILVKNGYNADALHGDLQQFQRDRVMKMFKERTLQILVATDVAARGLDVQNLTHVIHLGLPDDLETYIHRAGRTARAGKKGISAVILSPKNSFKIKPLERKIKSEFIKQTIPTSKQIVKSRLKHFTENLTTLEYKEEELSNFLPDLLDNFEPLSKEEIIKRLCWHELNHIWDYYDNKKDDLNISAKSQQQSSSNSERRGSNKESKYTRYYINLGRKDDIDKMELLDWIAQKIKLPKRLIQRLEIANKASYFESPNDASDRILSTLNGSTYQGRRVIVEYAKPLSRQSSRDENSRDKKRNRTRRKR